MKLLYINLDSRTDRRAEAEAEFARVSLTVERFAAVTGDNRPLSFNRSVYGCMELAKGQDLLLFEDDVVFDCDKVVLPEMPKGWMSLHLGGNLAGIDTTRDWRQPRRYSGNLATLYDCYQSQSTLYSAKCVDFILDNMRTDIMDEHNNIFDDWFRRNVLHKGNSYILIPMICYQRPSISNIWGDNWADYTGVHGYGNKLLSKL